MKVFLDTDVLVAALATRGLCADVVRLTLVHHELVITQPVLLELERALREKLKLPEPHLQRTLHYFRQFEVAVDRSATQQPVEIRDPADVEVVQSAIAAGAEVIITGDRDLLEAPSLPIRAVTPRAFWELQRGGDGPRAQKARPKLTPTEGVNPSSG